MNIMDLEIGDTGLGPDGTEYLVLRDVEERKPVLGKITVRTCKDQHGKTHKFMRGIEVKLLRVAPTEEAGGRT
jgi:hypothetical protein